MSNLEFILETLNNIEGVKVSGNANRAGIIFTVRNGDKMFNPFYVTYNNDARGSVRLNYSSTVPAGLGGYKYVTKTMTNQTTMLSAITEACAATAQHAENAKLRHESQNSRATVYNELMKSDVVEEGLYETSSFCGELLSVCETVVQPTIRVRRQEGENDKEFADRAAAFLSGLNEFLNSQENLV